MSNREGSRLPSMGHKKSSVNGSLKKNSSARKQSVSSQEPTERIPEIDSSKMSTGEGSRLSSMGHKKSSVKDSLQKNGSAQKQSVSSQESTERIQDIASSKMSTGEGRLSSMRSKYSSAKDSFQKNGSVEKQSVSSQISTGETPPHGSSFTDSILGKPSLEMKKSFPFERSSEEAGLSTPEEVLRGQSSEQAYLSPRSITSSEVPQGAGQDSEYLKKHVGIPLTLALAEVCVKKPKDPIHYLAAWLMKWRWNEQTRDAKLNDIEELRLERTRMLEEELAKAAAAASEHVEEEAAEEEAEEEEVEEEEEEGEDEGEEVLLPEASEEVVLSP